MIDIDKYRPEIASSESEADEVLSMLDALPCETVEQETVVSEILVAVKGRAKALDDRRKEITTPLHKAKKSVDDLFRPAVKRFEKIERLLKDKIAQAAIRRKQLQESTLAEARVKARNGEAFEIVEQLDAKIEGVSTRLVWRAALEDLSKVPWQFLAVDMDKVRAYMRKYDRSNEIPLVPGLRFYRDAEVRASRG